ncbi:MAG: leucine-rich repeat domain-containing protein, partial [Bacilli bacterium]|nr:leucine-rich repeat domain-containing protein [Bacilli bacterium]
MCNEIKEFNGIKYREDNNEITITGYLGMDENLNIPSEIDGKKVIGIEDKTAAWSSALKSIIIPNTVTKIEGSVLMNCKDLVSIKVDENNKNYADKDGVLFSKDEKALIKYPRKKKGFSYVIPNTVTSIESSAFYNSRLRKITIPSGVVSIGDYAFDRSKLEQITIPDTVMNIGENALKNCESLFNIKVDENNKNYAGKGGVLFSKGEKVLIKYPKGKMEKGYVIPDTVTRIEDWAFYDSNLMLIENSDKVTEI